jgi:hypothetical protein
VDVLVRLLSFFEPHGVYEQISSAASFYMKWALPIFFALSLASRYLETTTATLGDGASISEAVKDTLKAIMWSAVYAVFGVLVLRLEVHLCALFYEQGSLSVILEHYKDLLRSAQLVGEEGNFLDAGVNVLNFGTKAASWLLFYLSFLLLVFIYIFMRLAYAIAFALLYLWGLVAIPTMASKLLDMSHGWTRGVIALFIWPLIEATILMLMIPVFAAWGEHIMPHGAYQEAISQAGLYLLFFFCNLILSAIAVASALMAIKIAANENLLSGMVAPFAAGAIAGFTMWRGATSNVTKTFGGPVTKRASQLANFIDRTGGEKAASAVKGAFGATTSTLGRVVDSISRTPTEPTDGVVGREGSPGPSSSKSLNPNSRGPGKL